MSDGTYGKRVAACFWLDDAPVLTLKDKGEVKIAATHLRSEVAPASLTIPPPPEDAYSLHIHMRDNPRHELWLRGAHVYAGGYRQGATSVVDLRDAPVARIGCAFDIMQIYIPRASLAEATADLGMAHSDALVWQRGADDPAAHGIGKLLAHSLSAQGGSPLFAEHLLLALRSHVARTYMGARPVAPKATGGLSGWQLRRAQRLMEDGYATQLSIADLARECGLSAGHFTRAFRKSTGTQPHLYLTQLRLEAARRLLLEARAPLADVAVSCGFGDQSHFTRMFTRSMGISPKAWQRLQRG